MIGVVMYFVIDTNGLVIGEYYKHTDAMLASNNGIYQVFYSLR